MHRSSPVDAHPMHALLDARWILSLVVLVVNDHWAKAAFGNVVTGKLSDVAGMVVFPVLVGVGGSVCLRRSADWIRPFAVAAGGFLLVGIKTNHSFAGVVEALLEAASGRQQTIVVDATDLIGLVGLILAWRVLGEPRPMVRNAGRVVRPAAAALGVFACLASGVDEPMYGWTGVYELEDGSVVALSSDELRADRISEDSGLTWQYLSERPPDLRDPLDWPDRSREGCLNQRPDVCFRTLFDDGESRIEQRTGDDQPWRAVWSVRPSALWVMNTYGASSSIGVGSLVVTSDDTVILPAGTLGMLRRDAATEQWTPSVAEVRRFPWPIVGVFAMFALALDRALRHRFRSGAEAWFFATVVLLPAGWLIVGDPSNSFAVVTGMGLAVLAFAFAAVWSLSVAPSDGRTGSLRRQLVEITVLLLALTAPFTLFANDLISWRFCLALATVAGLGLPLAIGQHRRREIAQTTALADRPSLDAVADSPGHLDSESISIEPDRRRLIAAILIMITPLIVGPALAMAALPLFAALGSSVIDVLPWVGGLMAYLWMVFIGRTRLGIERWSVRPVIAAGVPFAYFSPWGLAFVPNEGLLVVTVLAVPLLVMLTAPIGESQQPQPAPSDSAEREEDEHLI